MTSLESGVGPSPGAGLSPADFDEFVRPHWQVIARVAARLAGDADCEDLTQEALLTAWSKRHQFDPARGSARSWLLAILLDRARKAQRRTARQGDRAELDVEPTAMSPDADSRLDVERAIARLPRRQREVISLFYFADLNTADTATTLGISQGAVKSNLHDARNRLAALLTSGDH